MKTFLLMLSFFLGFVLKNYSAEIPDEAKVQISVKVDKTIKMNPNDTVEGELQITVKLPTDLNNITDIRVLLDKSDKEVDNGMLSFINGNSVFYSKNEMLSTQGSITKYLKFKIISDSTLTLSNDKLVLLISNVRTEDKDLISLPIPSTLIRIKMKEPKKGQPNSEGVRLSLGANLDLGEGVKLNTFYGRLSYYLPSFSLNKERNLKDGDTCLMACGLYTGIYENNYFSITDYSDPEKMYYKTVGYVNDSVVKIERTLAARSTKTTSLNYGFFIKMPVTFYRSSYDKKEVRMSASIVNFEGIVRRIKYDYNYTKIQIDTQEVSLTGNESLLRYKEGESINTFDKYIGFLDLGFSYSSENYRVYFSATPWGIHRVDDYKAWYSYYHLYVTISEEKFGLRIGCDFRGEYGHKSPLYSLFITKEFNLSKLGDGLKL